MAMALLSNQLPVLSVFAGQNLASRNVNFKLQTWCQPETQT